jgi:polyisoprenoid-binding protein YceI
MRGISWIEGRSIYARRAVIQPGTHRLGPENATLSVHTRRGGAAAKAGHDLQMEVTSWEATFDVGADPESTTVELTADSTSLRVRKGTGGMKELGDDDKDNIHQTIDKEVLKRGDIAFRSTAVQSTSGGSRLRVQGELTLAGKTQPIDFDLETGEDGTLTGAAVVTQTKWGMKPYSALFGALKVLDEVEVTIDCHL